MPEMSRDEWRRKFSAALNEQLKDRAEREQFSLLADLAEDPRNGLHEIAPDTWIARRGRPDPGE